VSVISAALDSATTRDGWTINPASGAAGSQANLSGTGFGLNEQVNLAVDGNALASVTSDGNGNFTTSVTLPSSLGFGNHTVSAAGVSSGHSASVLFDITSSSSEGRGPLTCTTENSRPGNGFGDRNHCHHRAQRGRTQVRGRRYGGHRCGRAPR
jgi:hypothetical protein